MIVSLAVAGLLHGLAAAVMASKEQTVLAPDNLADSDFIRPAGNLPRLADLLTLEGRASIFYSYARETETSVLFTQSVGEGEGTTVFVPTNKAVQALARKPHEDPDGGVLGTMGAEHDAISKNNVQRWVGAHIIPSPDVNFTTTTPYKTLTPGATIAFSPISSEERRLTYEPMIDTDPAHSTSLKGKKISPGSTDSVRKTCVHAGTSNRRPGIPGDRLPVIDTDATHFASIKGPPSTDYDAAHLSDVKGSATHKPIWKQYKLNDGVYIISERKASNGVMYLIDGTVLV